MCTINSILRTFQLNKTLTICQCLENKWNTVLRKFDYLDYNDYSVYTGTSGVALLKLRYNDSDKKHLKVNRKKIHCRNQFQCKIF